MVKKIKEYILKVNKIAALEIFKGEEGEEYNYLITEKNKKGIAISFSKTNLKEMEEAIKVIQKDIPLILIVNGKGILNKKVQCNEGETEDILLSRALLNAKAEDFLYQSTEPLNNFCIVSAFRKSAAEEIISKLSENKIELAGFFLGPFIVQSIGELLPGWSYQYAITIRNQKLSFTDGLVENFITTENSSDELNTLTVANEKLLHSQIISFAACAAFIYKNYSFGGNLENEYSHTKNFTEKKIYRTSLVSVVSILLVILLSNFFFFQHYFKKSSELQLKIRNESGVLSQLDTLTKEFEEKNRLFQNTGMLGASRASFYADRIANSIPDNIKLKKLEVFPREKKADDEENTFNFHTEKIVIRGVCPGSFYVNEWIQSMRTLKWVKGVELLNYEQNKSENHGEFLIELTATEI